MITIKLHGPLRSAHNGPITVYAETVFQALEFVSKQLPGLRPDPLLGPKRARVVGYPTADDLNRPVSGDLTIDVVPAVHFSGSSLNQIIVGTLLIVTAALMVGVFWPAIIASAGASLVIGGVMQMLAPQQKLSAQEEDRSRYLGSPPNTVGIGTRIPILYGEDLIQGHIFSSDVDAAEVV